MKTLDRRLVLPLLMLAFLAAACDTLSLEPYSGETFDAATASVEGLQTATTGNYALLVDWGAYRSYTSFIMNMGEMAGDNVNMGVTTPDNLQHNFDYERTVNMGNITNVWEHSYKIIYSANQVITSADSLLAEGDPSADEAAQLNQLKGENLFLRAKTYHDLVRIFGRPYIQNPTENLGVPVVDVTASELLAGTATNINPPRATVAEVYDQIESDLIEAAELMTIPKTNSYASREAAWAVLSRVYLYMGENEQAIDYADQVINSGRYALVDTETYPQYFQMGNEENPENIFAIHHDDNQDFTFGSYSSMYYTSPGGIGWGQMFASEPIIELVNEHPEDVRSVFIEPQYIIEDGDTVRTETGEPEINELNGFDQYFITKFTFQNGVATLTSPPYIRLAEMYLNRAEAYAKLGQDQQALEDVNRIRERAGLSGEALYAAGDLQGHDSVLDAVLEERRIEFYEEGFRAFDIFRNNQPMVRDYPSVIKGDLTIAPDDYRVVYPIPQSAINRNPSLEQNPGYGA